MLPDRLSEEQEYKLALSFAEQLSGISITQALRILKELAPQLITNAHTVSGEVMVAAKERLFSGGDL